MRVLVTGVAGCLGSHIADSLIERDHDVTGIDNLATGRIDNVHPHVLFTQGDICELNASDRRVDVIVHCAASYADGTQWEEDAATNTLGTAIVCEFARSINARVVYLQTALCYGHNPGPDPIKLGTPINPDNSYAISKTAGESYLIHSGLDYVSLRLANIYGPRNLSGPIPTFYKRLSEGLECKVSDARRDFLHVEDFLRVAIPAVEGTGQGVYHVASGNDHSIMEAFGFVRDYVGTGGTATLLPRQDGDAPSILLDPSRTEQDFTWKPQVAFKDGIKSAVEWYKANGVERTFTHLKQD